MLVDTEALILKTTKFKETSLIVKAYTPSHGLLSFIVNGVRTNQKTNKGALFQVLNFLDVIIYYRENKALMHLKEYKFNVLYQDIPFHIIKSSLAIMMIEVIEHLVKEEEENEALYMFLKNQFLALDQEKGSLANFHIYFLAQLTQYIGIQAQGKYAKQSPFFNLKEACFSETENQFGCLKNQAAQHFSHAMHLEPLLLTKKERKTLLDTFLNYYEIHIEGFRKLKSIEILEQVLE